MITATCYSGSQIYFETTLLNEYLLLIGMIQFTSIVCLLFKYRNRSFFNENIAFLDTFIDAIYRKYENIVHWNFHQYHRMTCSIYLS